MARLENSGTDGYKGDQTNKKQTATSHYNSMAVFKLECLQEDI